MKQVKNQTALLSWATAVGFLILAVPPADSKRRPEPAERVEFSRAQYMVMNLNRGKDSTGFYLQESGRQSRLMLVQLEKASRQLEQVDRVYAKSKGRPDDKYLKGAQARIEAARMTAQQLAQQLQEAQAELKSSIQEVLLADQ
jgi:hypothetical protein